MSNQAAWLSSEHGQLEVKEAAYSKPGPGEVLIKNHVVAINPIDAKIQEHGVLVKTYPFILGFEVAGEIEEVGEGVTRFEKGERVCGLAIALRTQNLAHAGFQLHTCAIQFAVARIPTSVSYAQAAVLPIGLATAASGLFEPQYLGLPPPGPTPSANAEKRAILIWGGSSVVGSCAIQMAAATGLIVFTTASAKNHEYVRGLGAAYVFDYSNPNIVKEILAAVVGAGVELVGAYDVISEDDTTEKCAEVVHHFGGGVLLATRLGNRPEGVMLGDVRRSVVRPPSPTATEMPVWIAIWADFLEQGLEDGRLKAKPDPIVIKGGLDMCQEGLDLYRKGVSAAKIVVEIEE